MKHFFLALCLMFFGLLASAQQTIIPFNDNWKYLDNGSNQGTAWRSPSFNDESWKTGAGKLGYGAENINTVVGYGPVPSKKYITTYFRKSFTLSNPAAFAQYTALIRRDDGLIVYVNGVEVFRNNMRSGTVTYDSLATVSASDDGTATLNFNIPGSAFIAGTNVIAAEVHQQKANSSDLAFDLKLMTPDQTAPAMLSSARQVPLTAATGEISVTFRVTFSEPVIGVGRGDFSLATAGSVTGSITSDALRKVDVEGSVYDLTVTNIAGSGTLKLNLRSSNTGITDFVGNLIPNIAFTTGEVYTIDRTAPAVTGINRQDPPGSPTAAGSLSWLVQFSEPVSGVDAADFSIYVVNGTAAATLAGGAVTAVGTTGSLYEVNVDAVSGAGELRLDVNNAAEITDEAGNNLAAAFTTGQTFVVDRLAPFIASISRQQPLAEITNAETVTFRIVFSEPVSGVAASDFFFTGSSALAGTIAGDAVVAATADGTTYDLTVTGISGSGTASIAIAENNTGITDQLGNVLENSNAASQTYTIDQVAPSVITINRYNPFSEFTNANTLTFRIVFSEPVNPPAPSSFTLHTTGTVSGTLLANAIAPAGTNGTAFDVIVSSVSGDGVLRLDLNNTVITDLAGNAAPAFSGGATYDVDRAAPVVLSISRQLPSLQHTSAASVVFRVTFSEPVWQVDAADFGVSTLSGSVTGQTGAPVAVGTGGNIFDVPVHSLSGTGTIRLDLDPANVVLDQAGNGVAASFNGGETYVLEDDRNPSVSAITRLAPVFELTNAGTVSFRVQFSEPVTGFDAADLLLQATGSVSGTLATVNPAGADGTTYEVEVAGLSGDGTLRLDVLDGATVVDGTGNAMAGGFTGGEQYLLDHSAPVVTSITRHNPSEAITNAPAITWRISFSEKVSGLQLSAFALQLSGSISASLQQGLITAVGNEGMLYDLTLNSYSGAGTIQLDLVTSEGIRDDAGNAVTGSFTGAVYTIPDITAPVVTAINRNTPVSEQTNAGIVKWELIFSEPVSGVDAADFRIAATGSANGLLDTDAVSTADESGTRYLVTLRNISGAGSLRLDLLPSGSLIQDAHGNALAGGIVEGPLYLIDRVAPAVTGIYRQLPFSVTTAASSVTFRVIFSEPVTGVDAGDFQPTITGDVTGSVQSLQTAAGVENGYDVLVAGVTGNGTLRLDVVAGEKGISDALGNAYTEAFTTGNIYTIDQLPVVTAVNRSIPATELTAATSVTFRVVFSEPVSGVDPSDFRITGTGSATGELNSNSVATTNTFTYDVTLYNLVGAGSLRLDVASGGITDAAGNVMGLDFVNGSSYQVDRVLPYAVSSNRNAPLEAVTNAASVKWRVVFSEEVSGVDINDFTLVVSGTATGSLASVQPADESGALYDVTVAGISGQGTLKVDLKNTGTLVTDRAGNVIATGYNLGQSYTIDRIAPSVTSINRFLPLSSTASGSTVVYRIAFTEPVAGLDVSDFTLVTVNGGVVGFISEVNMVSNESTYEVKVSSVSGSGTFRIDLNASGTGITDVAGNPISSGFTAAQTYTIDQSPIVVSINRQLPLTASTSNHSVTFRVTFSKKVTGVDITDFLVNGISGNVRGTLELLANETSGTVAANAIKAVGTQGTTYDLTVRAIAGTGNLRLDLAPDGTNISDDEANPIQSGFTNGQTYDIISSGTEGFVSFSDIDPVPISSHTGEKPQAKVWKYANQWWSVLATTDGTRIFRLDGKKWTPTLRIATQTATKNDCIVAGNVTHILTFRLGANDSYIISVEYDPVTNAYVLWNRRKTKSILVLGSSAETATVAMDGNGRMWVANDLTNDIVVRWSDAPYSTWSAPITIATGISSDDISAIVAMPGKIGVMWSNQSTQRFGFRFHTNGASPTSWSADESPASQTARNLGLGFADDHMNLMCAADGTLYCAAKTGYDEPGIEKIILLVRRPSGTWDNAYPVTANEGTRPIVLLNETKGRLKVVYTSHENGGDLLYRESPVSTISFGRPFTLIGGNPDILYNYATSSHQAYQSEVVILASDIRTSADDIAVTVIASDDASPPTAVPPSVTRGLQQERMEIVSEVPLTANPNPFSHQAVVRFLIPETGAYSVSLYHASGSQVAMLQRGWSEKGQWQQLTVDGSRLKAGMYLVTLQTAQSSKTIKLLLTR